MIVRGYEVPNDVIGQAENWMRTNRLRLFRSAQLVEMLNRVIDPPAPKYAANWVANRLIQRHRRKGNIVQIERGLWEWKE